jgi:hypothetical protein
MATKQIPNRAKPPGRLVGKIAVQSKDHTPGDFNPLVLNWTVDKHRKVEDFNKVVDQSLKKPKLPKYEASLFASCFQNWG